MRDVPTVHDGNGVELELVPVTSLQPAATRASDSIFLKSLRLAATVCFGPLSGMT